MILFNKDFTTMWNVKLTPKMAVMHKYKLNITFKTWDYIKTERRKLETLLNWWLENENAREWGWFEEEKRQMFSYLTGKGRTDYRDLCKG